MNERAQFLAYVIKVFALNRVVRGVRDARPQPLIPTGPVLLSLLLGVVLRAGSYHDLAKQTKRRRWQHLIDWSGRISAYAMLHSQRVRLGTVSLKELAHDLDLALEEAVRWELWFDSG